MKQIKRITQIILSLSFLFLMSCKETPVSPNPTPEPEIHPWDLDGWDCVWHDEFDSAFIDTSKWEFEVNGWGGGNHELQYYTDRAVNAYTDNGSLVIQALKEPYTGPDGTRQYTSARLRTKFKGDWKYGRFDIYAKLPFGQGLWPAIWMLPTDWVYGGWAASGEIDIMELLGQQPNRVYGTLHYGGVPPENTHTGTDFTLPNGSFSSDYHLFTLIWEPNKFEWYVDDSLYLTQTEWYTNAVGYPAPFDQRFHMLLNVAVGGDWPGAPNATTVWPQQMQVDYVRVYQLPTGN